MRVGQTLTEQTISKLEDTLHFLLFFLLQISVGAQPRISSSLFEPPHKKSSKYSLYSLQHVHFQLQSNPLLSPQELHWQDAIITCLLLCAWVVRWERCLQEFARRGLAATWRWANCNPEHIFSLPPPGDMGVQATPTSPIKENIKYETLLYTPVNQQE